MELIEDIGPILGIVAFLGFAILALLIVLQAREVRRLREWAGRAPERAVEADEAADAAASARGAETEVAEGAGRLAAARERIAGVVGPPFDELNRRSPVDPRWLLAALAAVVIAAGVVTGGFGLFGDEDAPTEQGGERAGDGGPRQEQEFKVAVLNATQVEDDLAPVPAVTGLADVIADEVVKPAGFGIEATTNAAAGEERTLIMFEPEAEDAAAELAAAVQGELGDVEALAMTDETRNVAEGAELALLIGQDNSDFGQAQSDTAVP